MCLNEVWLTTQTPQTWLREAYKVMRLHTKDGVVKMVFPYRSMAGGVSWRNMFDEDLAIVESPAIPIGEWIERSSDEMLSRGYQTGFHCLATKKEAEEYAEVVADDCDLGLEDLVVVKVCVRKVRTVGEQTKVTVMVADEIMFPRVPQNHERLG